jgi:hypothetical protein
VATACNILNVLEYYGAIKQNVLAGFKETKCAGRFKDTKRAGSQENDILLQLPIWL